MMREQTKREIIVAFIPFPTAISEDLDHRNITSTERPNRSRFLLRTRSYHTSWPAIMVTPSPQSS
ncbi:unnamed protein product [Periconia digitata]|uniref:Uncharacterized protein n=1 Tax=Periconia digitata TaxID=1303443 RepID=A0A9W4UCU3_9PLEO|nr:unnamed protein product [Periconia digitata]